MAPRTQGVPPAELAGRDLPTSDLNTPLAQKALARWSKDHLAVSWFGAIGRETNARVRVVDGAKRR